MFRLVNRDFRRAQGTILGPILFIIYRKDISTNITSIVKIFADDTKIYCTINEPDKDVPALQLVLNRLSDWANKWQLPFNPEKSEVMHIAMHIGTDLSQVAV